MVCSSVHKSPLWKCERGFLPTTQQQTNRGSAAGERCLLKSITPSWSWILCWVCSLFFCVCVYFCALIELWKSACTSKTITSSWLWKGVGQQELFLGAESVTKAMTSQLCFHSFIQGGGMSDSIQRALIQAQVYTNYLLGSARMAMPGSWEDAFVPLLVQFLSLLWASKGDFS